MKQETCQSNSTPKEGAPVRGSKNFVRDNRTVYPYAYFLGMEILSNKPTRALPLALAYSHCLCPFGASFPSVVNFATRSLAGLQPGLRLTCISEESAPSRSHSQTHCISDLFGVSPCDQFKSVRVVVLMVVGKKHSYSIRVAKALPQDPSVQLPGHEHNRHRARSQNASTTRPRRSSPQMIV